MAAKFKQGNVSVVRATLEHAEYIGANLRAEDRAEIWASHHKTGPEALPDVWKRSDVCLTVLYKGVPAAMFGAVPFTLLAGAGPWALGTDDVDKIKLIYARYSREFVELMLLKYSYLLNYADARNKVAIDWLRFCGFVLDEARPYGPDNVLFHRFTMIRKG